MKLPIEIIPGTIPPKFRYSQTITTPHGNVQSVEYVGCVSTSMEAALYDLIRIAKQLETENKTLKARK